MVVVSVSFYIAVCLPERSFSVLVIIMVVPITRPVEDPRKRRSTTAKILILLLS